MEKLIDILGWIIFIGMCFCTGVCIIIIVWSTIDDELDVYHRKRHQKRIEKEYMDKLKPKP